MDVYDVAKDPFAMQGLSGLTQAQLYCQQMSQFLNSAQFCNAAPFIGHMDKLTLAKQYAAEVRKRKPQMQVSRITERDKAG